MPAKGPAQLCPLCGAALAAGSRFCGACGSPRDSQAGVACPACQAPNPRRARFCQTCGASLDSPAQADRRVITVLFADLSGFTRMTEEADPEEVREFIADCLDRLSECIARWGGHVDKFIGDCVMALFGAPVAYENEEERAVRAALDMQETLGATGSLKYRPEVRIGINTGSVVTGLFAGGGARNYTAVGDAVNVASRLQGLCEPGGILVGQATYEQTRHLFEYGDEQLLQVKGRQEPVRARTVFGLQAERGELRGFEGERTRFIGRSEELDGLRERWRRAREGEFQLCLVTGPAGLGKSRLVDELIAAAELAGDAIARGRSYPYASSRPWEPLAELIRDLVGAAGDVPAAEIAERIAGADSTAWPPEELAGLKIVLGSQLSEAAELQPYSAGERHERAARAIVRAVRSAAASPRLFVLEDLHWSDSATLEFLSTLPALGLEMPVFLILVSRPALPGETPLARMLDRLSDRIDLPPLAPNQVGEMIDALLRPHELPESFLTDIVERAAGNPLFVEESVKSLAERGVLGRQSGVWRLVGEPRTVAVPETIESLLTTRIDALDGSAKQVLQCAAIVGRRFWSRVLADALVQRPVERELSDLEDGAFVRSLPFSSLGDSPEFMFEHLLLHEVAYDGMLRGLRSELHGAVAHWLESHSAGASGEYDEWIAFHHERSKEPARAVPYLERSAQNARDRGALREARQLAKRALELASLAGDKARLLGLAEDLASEAGEAEARQQAIEELVRLARDEDDERVAAEAAYRRARYLLDSGDLVGARSAGEAALERFEWLDDVSLQADALRLLGRVAHLWGDYPQALRHYRASLPLEREAGDQYGQAEIFDRLGLVQIDLDDFTTALDYFEAARDLCLELGDRPAEARVTGHQAMAQYWLARYEEAEATAREALKLADCCASRQAQSGAKLTLAMVLAARGSSAEAEELLAQVRDFARQQRQPGFEARAWLALAQATTGDDARARARRACQLAKESGVVHVEILGLTREAELDLDVGDWRRADEHSREAMRLLNLHGNIPGPEEAVVYTRARVLQAVGKVREAAETLGRARQIVQGKADRIADVAQRRRYLQNVPLNREILAADLLDQDREVPGEAR